MCVDSCADSRDSARLAEPFRVDGWKVLSWNGIHRAVKAANRVEEAWSLVNFLDRHPHGRTHACCSPHQELAGFQALVEGSSCRFRPDTFGVPKVDLHNLGWSRDFGKLRLVAQPSSARPPVLAAAPVIIR